MSGSWGDKGKMPKPPKDVDETVEIQSILKRGIVYGE